VTLQATPPTHATHGENRAPYQHDTRTELNQDVEPIFVDDFSIAISKKLLRHSRASSIIGRSMATSSKDTSKGQMRAIAMVRQALIEKKMTQAELADAADCHEKTIQNMLAGKSVRQQTLFDVCMVLGLPYEEVQHQWNGGGPLPAAVDYDRSTPDTAGQGGEVSPTYMGAYTRAAVDHYLGSYLTLRPAFSTPKMIVAYRTDITWDPDWPSLLFAERDRPDAPYAHRGRLYIPPASQFLHLVSLTKGAMRMIIVSQIDRHGLMQGLITTLNKRKAQFVPVAAPILYRQQSNFADTPLGDIDQTNPAYDAYARMLADTVDQGYAALVSA
jgi:DNA-binding Xre family transcriptional regulator